MSRHTLAMGIAAFGLVDGLIHGYLVLSVFHGHFLGNLLPTLFVLDFIGWIALIAAFLLSLASYRWLHPVIDLTMALYAAVEIVVWISKGGPDPLGLGYLAKGVEAVLIVGLLVHALSAGPRESAQTISAAR